MFDKKIFALPFMKRAFLLSCIAAFIRGVLVVGQAWCLATYIVGVWEGGTVVSFAGWLVGFFVCFVARHAVLTIQEWYLDKRAIDLATHLRTRLLEVVYETGQAVVADSEDTTASSFGGSGAVVSSLQSGVDAIENYVKLMAVKTTALVIVPAVILVATYMFDWVSGLIATIAYPCIIMFMILIGSTAKDQATKRHAVFLRMSSHFIDSLRGIDTLQAFGKSSLQSKRIYDVSERFREATMKTLRIAQLSSAVLDLFATLALAAVAIMLGFRLVETTIMFFPALFVLIMVPEYFRPVREFAADYHATLEGKTALELTLQLIDKAQVSTQAKDCSCEAVTVQQNEVVQPKEVVQQKEAVQQKDQALPEGVFHDAASTGGACHSPASPTLCCEHLNFSYGTHRVLSDVSFNIATPARVAVVGVSGSGKSTLLSVLSGFLPGFEGNVWVAGEKLNRQYAPQWQKRLAYIPQSPHIFCGTIRDNIAFYAPDASRDAVYEALAYVGLDDFVATLPEGIHTVIGEGGLSLSGGQAHRIALARVFLCDDRDVLVLDEPTAHLDIETELELKEKLLPLMNNRLVLFATHRWHWVLDMDYVIALDHGRVVWQSASDAFWQEGVGRIHAGQVIA